MHLRTLQGSFVPTVVPDSCGLFAPDYRLTTPSSPRTLAWNCLAHYFGLGLCCYATRAFLVGVVKELRPIKVDLFRPK